MAATPVVERRENSAIATPMVDLSALSAGGQALLEKLKEVEARSAPIELDELTSLVANLELSTEDVSPWVAFNSKLYRRNLVLQGRDFTALVLCWRSGQRTPIHNHHGSACVVKVLEGIASEIVFDHGPNGMVFPAGCRHYAKGETFASFDNDTHQMVNLQTDPQDLITLHVYSPPLRSMEFVELGETTLADHDAGLLEPARSYWRPPQPGETSLPPKATVVEPTGKVSVVIVGGGCSGTLTAVQLLRQSSRPDLDITIVEPRERVARGAAYSTLSPHHLLNVPAHGMSAFPDQPDHFLSWLIRNGHPYKSHHFVPRRIFGDYLQACLDRAVDTMREGDQFRVVHRRVVSALPEGTNGWWLELDDETKLQSDVVVLALGNEPPADAVGHVSKSDRVIANPWVETTPEQLMQCEHILLVGTGLTAVDFAYHLTCAGYQGRFTAISRRAQMPIGHRLVATPISAPALLFERGIPLSRKLRAFRRAARELEARGGDWRSLMDGIRPHIQDLWRALSDSEQRRFFRHLRRHWDLHRHRIAPEVEEVLLNLVAEGRLEILSGRVVSIEEDGSKARAQFRRDDHSPLQTAEADIAIVCTGPSERIERRQDALTQGLLANNIAVPDGHHMGFWTNSCGGMLGPRGETRNGLFAIGPLRKGSLWETTAMREIRLQAEHIAERIVASVEAYGIGL